MYKIGSFNCLNFGAGTTKDTKKFAEIIYGEGFDIVALQEIKGPGALNRILDALKCFGRVTWCGMADEVVNDYAFIWNADKFELANASECGLKRQYAPRIYKQYRIDRQEGQTDLIREPYYARFFPIKGPYIEIRLINTHIRFTKGSSVAENTPGAVAMRKNEFNVLTKAIYAKEADKRYGNNRPAYTILLGDYNLNLPSSTAGAPYLLEQFTIADGNSSKVIRTVQSSLSTLVKTNDDEKKDESNAFASNYDHFSYDEKRFSDSYINCERINAIKKYYSDDYEKYSKNISDHVPVMMKFNIRG
ncbi:MAG: hypothetical protein J6C06_04625 [Lachnospiraceae bacterium]|nr:hypothetical protein [Lachnospiraceae bacterium]